MTLRRRLALVAAVAVAVAIAMASAIVFVVVRGELRGRLDDELQQAGRAAALARLPLAAGAPALRGAGTDGSTALGPGAAGSGMGGSGTPGPGAPRSGAGDPGAPVPGGVDGPSPPLLRRPFAAPRDALGLQTTYLALVSADGRRLWPRAEAGVPRLPVTAATRAVAAGERGPHFADARIDDTPVRVFTTDLRGLGPGYALQVARPLTDVDRTLDRLALVLVLVSAGGIALAAALGRLVARTALRPVGRLTDAVEHVGETGDLTRRIALGEPRGLVRARSRPPAAAVDRGAGDGGEDEIARLARSFNAMLAALEASVGRQRQLVADASHELRTPLTSLRTNIEVLALPAALPEEERLRLIADVVEQLDELGGLVGDLVELAREAEPEQAVEDVRLDQLVAEAVARAARRPRAPSFATELEPCLVRGVPARLDRAVANLLDNAAKWSPPGSAVEVALRGGELTVRDHGPGIAPADLPHVFERFYRAPSARGMSGSGLGLAIVRQVAELHGGRASAEAAPGGGALLRLSLPAEAVAVPDAVAPLA